MPASFAAPGLCIPVLPQALITTNKAAQRKSPRRRFEPGEIMESRIPPDGRDWGGSTWGLLGNGTSVGSPTPALVTGF
jgi:hypothetical protein